jgi:TolA-binding protein
MDRIEIAACPSGAVWPSHAFGSALVTCLAIAVASAAPRLSAQAEDREAALSYNTASRLYEQKNWAESFEAFTRFLDRFPAHERALEARFARGFSALRLGRPAAAIEDLRSSSAKRDARWADDAEFWLGRALEAVAESRSVDAPERKKELDEAARAYGRAVALRERELAETPKDAAELAVRVEECVAAIASEGEAWYRVGNLGSSSQALTPLLRMKDRAGKLSAWRRGIYFLCLTRHDDVSAGSGDADFRSVIGCLSLITSPGNESDPIWPEAALFHARILVRAGQHGEAVALCERVEARGGDRAHEAVLERSRALDASGAPASLERAQRELADLAAKEPAHPLVSRVIAEQGFILFRLSRHAEAAARFAAALESERLETCAPALVPLALLRLGQSLMLAEDARVADASRVLAVAVEAAERADATRAKGAAVLLPQARYWAAEAELAGKGSVAELREAALRAARAFESIARESAVDDPDTAEDALHRASDAYLRAGAAVDCARVARAYRAVYPTDEARHFVASLEISGRNALHAPEGALPEEERREAARWYSEAAARTGEPGEKLRFLYLAGVAHYHHGDPREAVRVLESVHEKRGSAERGAEIDVDIAFYLADAIVRSAAPPPGERSASPEARPLLERAAALFADYLAAARADPRPARNRHVSAALLHRALCLRWIGAAIGARDAFDAYLQALPDGPAAPSARFFLGEIHLELGDRPAALKAFVSASETADDELAARALLEAAILERALERPASAVERLDAASGRLARFQGAESLRRDVRYEHALSLLEADRADEALLALEAFASEYPADARSGDARLELGALRLDAGDTRGALQAVAPLVAGRADTRLRDEALYLVAWIHAESASSASEEAARGEAHRAMEEAYATLVAEHPNSERALDALLEWGKALFNRGAYREAKVRLQGLVDRTQGVGASDDERLVSRREEALHALAFAHFQEKEYAVARGLFDEVESVRRTPTALGASAVFLAGKSYASSGDDRAAVARFERVVGPLRSVSDPSIEESLFRLGECLHRLQEYPKAIATFGRLLEEFPQGAWRHDARCGLGLALQNSDRLELAIQELRKVVRETTAPIAARAQYHIGECRMDEKEYREAAREFLVVAANFDVGGTHADWVRRALLSAGIAYEAAGDFASARAQWKDLIERYPDCDEARAAKARLATAVDR